MSRSISPEIHASPREGPDAREDRLLAALERIERRLAHVEGATARLEHAAARAPAVVATIADIVDGLVERLAARGVDVDERMRALLAAVEQLTSRRALDALAAVLASEIMAPQVTEVIGRVGRAITGAEHEARPIGAWGALRALRDPEVQRAVGFLVAAARRFGAELADVPALPAGGAA